jgi:hypothetical protein
VSVCLSLSLCLGPSVPVMSSLPIALKDVLEDADKLSWLLAFIHRYEAYYEKGLGGKSGGRSQLISSPAVSNPKKKSSFFSFGDDDDKKKKDPANASSTSYQPPPSIASDSKIWNAAVMFLLELQQYNRLESADRVPQAQRILEKFFIRNALDGLDTASLPVLAFLPKEELEILQKVYKSAKDFSLRAEDRYKVFTPSLFEAAERSAHKYLETTCLLAFMGSPEFTQVAPLPVQQQEKGAGILNNQSCLSATAVVSLSQILADNSFRMTFMAFLLETREHGELACWCHCEFLLWPVVRKAEEACKMAVDAKAPTDGGGDGGQATKDSLKDIWQALLLIYLAFLDGTNSTTPCRVSGVVLRQFKVLLRKCPFQLPQHLNVLCPQSVENAAEFGFQDPERVLDHLSLVVQTTQALQECLVQYIHGKKFIPFTESSLFPEVQSVGPCPCPFRPFLI